MLLLRWKITEGYFRTILNWKFNSNWGRPRNKLVLFKSAATHLYRLQECQMRSALAVNWTRHVGSVTCTQYCWTMSLTCFITFIKFKFWACSFSIDSRAQPLSFSWDIKLLKKLLISLSLEKTSWPSLYRYLSACSFSYHKKVIKAL